MINDIYEVFTEETANIDCACGPGCATCCTRSVTLTTAEGRLIVDYLRSGGRSMPELPRDRRALRPSLTTNGLAGCYLTGQEVAEEDEEPWSFEPCFFLRGGLCGIYPVRPFACRSFLSLVNCEKSGQAEAPEWLVTLAIVTNQLLENLDQGGRWGNLADVLAFLDLDSGEDVRLAARGRLLLNLPTPAMLVVPDEIPLVKRYLGKLGKVGGQDLNGLMFR